jgi:hypothetical protein
MKVHRGWKKKYQGESLVGRLNYNSKAEQFVFRPSNYRRLGKVVGYGLSGGLATMASNAIKGTPMKKYLPKMSRRQRNLEPRAIPPQFLAYAGRGRQAMVRG